MLDSFTLRTFKRTIAPWSSTEINVVGNKIYGWEIPDNIEVNLDDGEYIIIRQGLKYETEAGGVFHKVKLNNNSGFPVSVTIIAGFGDIKDDSVFFSGTVKVEPKRAYPVFQRAVVGLNTVQNLAAPEVPDYGYAVVQNRGTNDLYIRAFPKEYTYAPPDSDVNSAFLLPPNASIALPPYLSTNYEFKFWRPRSLNKADVFITYFIYE